MKLNRVITILIIGLFFLIGRGVSFAKEYTRVTDIQLDGEDAIGKKATLCLQRGDIEDYGDGKHFLGTEFSEGGRSGLIYIYFEKNQKELIKKITPHPDPYNCTMTTVKIFEVGGSTPSVSARLISVGKQTQFR